MLDLRVLGSHQGQQNKVELVAMDLNQVLWDTGARGVVENGKIVHLPDLHEAMFNKALEAYGQKPMNHAEYEEKFQGKSSQQKLELLGVPQFDAQGRDQWKLISEEKTKLTVSEAPRYLDEEQVNAMRAKLEAVKETGVQVALVTNSDRATLDFALNKIGKEYFDVVISKDDTIEKNGEQVKVKAKPAPDMLLLAAERAGVDMANVMFVTNPGLGVKAAQVAEVGAVAVVDNAKDLTPQTIKQAIGLAEQGKSGAISDAVSKDNAMQIVLQHVAASARVKGLDPDAAVRNALMIDANLAADKRPDQGAERSV